MSATEAKEAVADEEAAAAADAAAGGASGAPSSPSGSSLDGSGPTEGVEGMPSWQTVVIGADELSEYVGKPTYSSERFYDSNPPGVVTGLAWTSMGGAVLYVESQPVGTRHLSVAGQGGDAAADGGGGGSGGGGGGGGVVRTGQMGDVMKESCTIAHTFARGFLGGIEPSNAFLEEATLHIHVPEGATPKDGPSAGITIVTSLLSLAMGKPPRSDLAMTGELSLTGKVLPIGGVKEKTIAARRAGVTHIVFPKANERDYAELPEILKEGLTPHFASDYEQVYRVAFADDALSTD